jgi:hypothetical protein
MPSSAATPFLWTAVLVLVLAACGGTAPPPGPTTVTPGGGVVVVEGDDGSRLELVFPAGAVIEPLAVDVRPLVPAVGARATYEVTPSGVALREPMTLRYVPPIGQALTGASTFTVGDVAEVIPLPSVAINPRLLEGRSSVLGPVGPLVDGAARLQGGGGLLNVADISCRIAVDSLLTRLESARNFSFSFPQPAKELIAQYEATEQLCAEDSDYFASQIGLMQTAACEGLRDAEADAAVAVSDTAQAFRDAVGPLLNWVAMEQLTGAECDFDLNGSLQREFDEFLEAYETKLEQGDLPSTYDDLWNELRDVATVAADAASNGNFEAQEAIEQRLLGPIYGLLRDAAYEHCREDDEQVYLADLLWGGGVKRRPLPTALPAGIARLSVGDVPSWAPFSESDLKTDIQLCASKVTVEVFTPVPEEREDLSETLEGGETPGNHTTTASTRAPATGSLVLDGDIAALQCSASVSEDELVLKLNGVEIERRQRSGAALLGTRVDVELEDALDTANIDATVKGTYTLDIVREGPVCGDEVPFGDSPFTIFSVDLEIDPAPTLSGASANPTGIAADAATAVAFSLDYEDEGENLSTLDLEFRFGARADPSEVNLTTSPDVSGFSSATGTGTVNTTLTIFCSMRGTNPLTVAFKLVDDFDQESDEQTASVTIDYAECSQ